MKKLVNPFVWLLVAMLYVVLGVKCVMMWDAGRGAAELGSRLPHYLALPVLLTVGILLANWLEAKILVEPDGAPQLRRVLMLTLTLFLYIEGILLFVPFTAENRMLFVHLLLSGFCVFFIGLGVLMPHLKRNRIAGVRYTWTLTDPAVWRESNRVGGRYTIVMGIILGASQFFTQRREMFFSTLELWAFITYVVALTLHSRMIALKHHPPQER